MQKGSVFPCIGSPMGWPCARNAGTRATSDGHSFAAMMIGGALEGLGFSVWGSEFEVLSSVFSGFGPLAAAVSRYQHNFHDAKGADPLQLRGPARSGVSGM
jgi:hypothetical protein